MIVLLLCMAAFGLLIWWTAELPELWLAIIVGVPVVQYLI